MLHTKIHFIAVSALLTTWTFVAKAQQQPAGTNVPTRSSAQAPLAATSTEPILQEPVIDASTTRSSLPNTPLLVTGLVVLGGSYGASVAAAAISDRESDNRLYYPVAGPWMALSERDCAAEPCARKTLGTTLLVGSGVLQGVGALSMVLSFVIPRKTTHSWSLIGNEAISVAPLAGAGEVGATAVGRF